MPKTDRKDKQKFKNYKESYRSSIICSFENPVRSI